MDAQKQIILESEISDFIKKDNGCNTHFDYNRSNIDNSLKSIRVTTYNPKKQETFLLIEIPCTNEDMIIESLKQISSWVRTHSISDQEFSHTVLWAKKGDAHTYKSYFYATNARKALDKFFYDKSEAEYVIYEVKINPIA
jgi:hypothetical protein